MPKKKSTKQNEDKITTGNIRDISGAVTIATGDISGNISVQHTTATGISAAEIKQLFDQLYSAIESRQETTPAAKEDLKAEVQEIQQTVTEAAASQKPVEESSLSRHFRNIARMAPDVLDVIVATLGNPLAGLGVAVKKIAEKAKEDTVSK
jgi:cell division septum initiation protein DivIVA